MWIGILGIFMVSCGTSKVLTSPKTEAAGFEASGDYKSAVTLWEQYFSETPIENVTGSEFANAAKSAFKAGNSAKAKSWFDQARYKNYADDEMYVTLAKIYNGEDNLSKELSALEYYIENYGSDNVEVNGRLFAIYSEIDSNEQALQMWSVMDAGAKGTEANLLHYFKVNKALENNLVCDSVSLEILKMNPENMGALEWNAKKYYWAGQNRYKREMDKYNQKKTRKNYTILLKELDLVTADFKKALPYLEKLWKLDPGKEYAGYFANIYALFGDEKKTNYYKNYMK